MNLRMSNNKTYQVNKSQDSISNNDNSSQSFLEGQYSLRPKNKTITLNSSGLLHNGSCDQTIDDYPDLTYDLEDKPIEEMIREELSKPLPNEISLENNSFYLKRNIKKVTSCFRQIQGINRYLKFNCIDNSTLMKAVSYMKYEHFQPNVRIFSEGDQSNKFYGIISGRVSIRSLKTIGHEVINFEIIPKTIEEEKTVFGSGMCFGEWAIIYNMPRTASAYTLTETDLFSLDKEYFNLTLAKEIIKADINKKIFVTQKIPALANCGKTRNILTQIVPTFHESGSVVYSEFDKADFIYVLYQGECILTKFINPDQIEDVRLQKEKMITLFKVVKGGILGLETINSNAKYATNLLVTRDFTVLYQIGLRFLKDCFVSITKFLRPMFNTQNELIQSAIKREMFIMEKRKKELRIQIRNKNKSTENIIAKKTIAIINEMSNQKNSSKRTLNIKIKQNRPRDSFVDHKKKYSMFKLLLSKSQVMLINNKIAAPKTISALISKSQKPNLIKDSTTRETPIKTNDFLSMIVKKNRRKDEKKDKREIKKINDMISNFPQFPYSNRIPIFSYDTGSFDLPLIGQNGG